MLILSDIVLVEELECRVEPAPQLTCAVVIDLGRPNLPSGDDIVECLECYEVGEPTNIKDVSRQLFTEIRNATKLANLGNNREQFAAQFLLPALRSTHMVYEELREDVFG